MNAAAESHWEALPLCGALLIEASAGTGKTHTLALLYLRLLLCRDDLDPASILVVSFTEAATAELRERLRARLTEAERLLRAIAGQRPEDAVDSDLLPWLRPLCPTPTQAAVLLARIETARLGFDQAAIHTIHGFCARLLSDFAFATGAALERGQALDADALLRELVYDRWRSQLAGDDPLRWQILAALGGSPEALWKLLRPAFNLPDARVLTPPPSTVPRAEFDAAFAALAAPDARAELAAVLNAPARQYSLSADFKRLLSAINEWLAAGNANAVLDFKNADAAFEKAQVSRPKPERDLGEVPIIARLRTVLTLDQRRRNALQAELIAGLIADLREALVARCRRVPGHTYGDLIAEVASALADDRDGKLAAQLRARWPVALIDEFQDTDLTQFGIFRRIYDDGRQGLLALIGDAKQAIYAFRGGDVQVCRAALQLPDRHTHTLRVNYRSAPRLVAAVNQLFTQAGADQVFGDPAIGFVAAQSPRAAVAGEAGRPFAFVFADADPSVDRPRTGEARKRCIKACADAIAASLDGPAGCRPGQLAVLVNRNHDVGAIRRALARRGVPVAAQVQQSVFESHAADSLRILLAALAEPGREDRLRAALLGPWFAWPLDQVAALANTEPAWSALLDQFEQARSRWQTHGPAAALLPWLQQASAGLLAATAVAEGERFLTDARHLLELLQSEFTRRPGIAELLDWLDRGGADDAITRSDERLLRLESDGDRVRVLTLHGAKGLEFDRVWLPLLWTPPPGGRSSAAPAFVVCHHQGERVIDTGGKDFVAHQQAEQADREAEATRLLYVGLTRARSQCTLFYPQRLAVEPASALTRLLRAIAAKRDPAGDVAATLADLAAAADSPFSLATEWPEASGRRPPAAEPASATPATAALPEPRPFETLWSFTRLHQGGHAQALAGDSAGHDDERITAAPEGDLDAGVPDAELGLLADLAGPGFGSALHALFEQALAAAPVAAGVVDPASIRRSLRRFGIDPVAPPVLTAIGRLLDRCLATELAPDLRLGALPAAARAAEWEFELPLRAVNRARLEALLAAQGYTQPLAGGALLAGALTGSADLVFEWQGRFYIVDYKSNWLGASAGNYAADALAKTMHEAGYTLQYLLYTVALQRYLRRRIGPAYDYAEHFGGVYYLFVRAFGLAPGLGLHYARPEASLIAAIDELLDGAGVAP